MPPERWMVEVAPRPKTFGSVVKGLRLERGWSQREMSRRTGIDQTEISKFERDSYKHPKPEIIATYEDSFGLTRGSLSHLPWGRAAIPEIDVPDRGVMIGPAEPELIEAVRALFLLEPEQIPGAAQMIRMLAEKRPARDDERAVG